MNRVEAFKKRDMRGGKRARAQLSVAKTQQRTISHGSNTITNELVIANIAQGSPSTQEDSSIGRTISSKGDNSTGMRSNENLQCSSPLERLAKS